MDVETNSSRFEPPGQRRVQLHEPSSVSQAWLTNHWYLVQVTWGVGGSITARLFDSDGVTLLNAVSAVDNSIVSGGLAFRGFGPTFNVDTVTKAVQNDDWYSLDLVGASNKLSIATSTPTDGTNLSGTTLSPKIELYDPSGNLVATGTVGSNGRDQSIQFLQTTQGTYRIHVAAQAGSSGVYFLGVAAQALPVPTIVWAPPDDIPYGAALSPTQLNATANYAGSTVPGIIVYSYGSGTVLNAGANQTLSATFTPSDPTTFSPATATVSINVNPAPLTVTVNNASKVYGDPNPTFRRGSRDLFWVKRPPS